MTAERPSLRDVYAARGRTAGNLRATPLVPAAALGGESEVWLKLEHHQITGSFKLRGATNAVLALGEAERARGVVGVSTGNHGRGLAHAARTAETACIICMSSLVPRNKIEGIEALGAEVRIVGQSQDEAQFEVDRLVAEDGMTMLPPFDHRDIIAGQGTLGLEVMEEAPDTETVIVPVSGGGLISGVALVAKAINPRARVIGVSMERGAAMHQSQKLGRPVEVEELPTLADALGGGIGLDNRYTFGMVRELVDDLILVAEEEIAAAIAHAYWRESQIVEGSGAVGIAAILAGRVRPRGRTVVLLTGGNIDPILHHELISAHQDRG